MHINVSAATRSVRLTDPYVFSAFDVVADPPNTSSEVVADIMGDDATVADADHVWVAVNAVPRLTGHVVAKEWESNYETMLAFADSMDWLSDDRTMIKAHIVRS